MTTKKKVLIIGGGAAGMMASIAAGQDGHAVTILEKNEKLGKKLFITGKGRCNVTNDCDRETFFSQIIHNEKFMYSSFDLCSNYLVQTFFEDWGVPLKVERGGRVFPVSDKSSDILRALEKKLRSLDVKVCLNTCVKGLLLEDLAEDFVHTKENKAAKKRCVGVTLTDGTAIYADHVIVATGGCSYPLTGSTGDGYRFAKACGMEVTDCYPSLVPFVAAESFCKTLQGISLKNVSVKLCADQKCIYEGFGEMLFTHFGVSGPLILSASTYATKQLAARNKLILHIDLKPALSKEQLDVRLQKLLLENKSKNFQNAVSSLLPQKLLDVVIERTGIDKTIKAMEVTKQMRKELIDMLKDFTVTILKTREFNEAIITQGGISVKEVSPTTMHAKKVIGLSFAGEVLDLDAMTGGYNLQIAWSTGFAAGTYLDDNGDGDK